MNKGVCVILVFCIVFWAAVIWAVWSWCRQEEMLSGWTDRSGYRVSLSDAGVPADEHERCLEWAFGEDILSVDLKLWPPQWNDRHSDIFVMHGYDNCGESLIAVGQAYCDRPLAITIVSDGGFIITDCNFVEIEQ